MAWNVAGSLRGPQGSPGPKGDKGDKGDQGIQGVPGLQGVKGDTGDRGVEGPAGADGVDGPSYRGEWDSGTDYDAGDMVSHEGSTWITVGGDEIGEPGVGTGWSYFAAKGARGPEGPAGPAGADGVVGTKWFAGTGAPTDGNTGGSRPGDLYLDLTDGTVYQLS